MLGPNAKAHRRNELVNGAKRMIAVVALVVLMCVLHSSFFIDAVAGEQEEVKAGFLGTGKTLPATPRYRPERLGDEIFKTFKPAREIRSIVSVGDTLWIGTEGGLFSYSVLVDTLVKVNGDFFPSIRVITVDDDGFLWIGDDEGVSVRRDGRWFRYPSGEYRSLSNVRDIFCENKRTWIATYGNGAGYLLGDSARWYTRNDSLLDDRVNRVLPESESSVLFGTASGLCRADTLHWESYRYGKRIPVGSVDDLVIDEEGNLFMAIAHHGVVQYNMGRVRIFGVKDGLPSLEVNAFSFDPEGVLWAAGKGGVSSFDGSGWVPFNNGGDNLGKYRFLSIAHDLEGNLYMGTDKGSVIMVMANRVKKITIPQDFPEAMVSKIKSAGGVIWMVGGGRVFYSEGNVLKELLLPEPWIDGQVNDIVPSKGDGGVWLAARFGILHKRGDVWQIFDRRQGLPTENFTLAARDSSSNLWFASFDSGLFELDGKKWIHYTTKDGLPENRVSSLLFDGGGTPWVATENSRVARFVGGRWHELSLPGFVPNRGFEKSRIDTSILSMPGVRVIERSSYVRPGDPLVVLGVDDRGNCIAVTPVGIYRYVQTGKWQVVSFPAKLGTPVPTAVTMAPDGSLYVGTSDRGVLVLSADRTWHLLGTDEGLGDLCILSICRDYRDRIWVGTRKGGISLLTGSWTVR